MSNDKHYPTHPGAEYPPIMTCKIPLEEYESLKRENERLKGDISDLRDDRKSSIAIIDELNAENAELKAENKRLKKCEIFKMQHFFCEEVIACESAKNRRLKRALWLAIARRAKDRAMTCDNFAYLGDTERDINMGLARTWMKCRLLRPSEWSKLWREFERKCRAKAEEYK